MKLFGHFVTFVLSVAAAVGLSVISMNALAQQDSVKSQSERVDQKSVCVASSDEQALECPEGELFMARLALSEVDVQNPLVRESRLLNTMALYCDTNYQIHQTQAGVLCVLTHERIELAADEDNAAIESEADETAEANDE